MNSINNEIQELSRLIDGSNNIVVFTGAGISTDSGLPDYRGPEGVWTKNPEAQFSKKPLDQLQAVADLKKAVEGAEPNISHFAVTKLWELGKLNCVITQNVDRLHQAAGIPDSRIFELHGSGDNVVAFGQQLDKTTWYGAEKAAFSCSLMIVLGSSLSVYPAAGLVEIAQKMGADTVIINNQYTDYDREATLVIRGSIADYLPHAISQLDNSNPN